MNNNRKPVCPVPYSSNFEYTLPTAMPHRQNHKAALFSHQRDQHSIATMKSNRKKLRQSKNQRKKAGSSSPHAGPQGIQTPKTSHQVSNLHSMPNRSRLLTHINRLSTSPPDIIFCIIDHLHHLSDLLALKETCHALWNVVVATPTSTLETLVYQSTPRFLPLRVWLWESFENCGISRMGYKMWRDIERSHSGCIDYCIDGQKMRAFFGWKTGKFSKICGFWLYRLRYFVLKRYLGRGRWAVVKRREIVISRDEYIHDITLLE